VTAAFEPLFDDSGVVDAEFSYDPGLLVYSIPAFYARGILI